MSDRIKTTKNIYTRTSSFGFITYLLLLFISLLWQTSAIAEPLTDAGCLSCHSKTITLPAEEDADEDEAPPTVAAVHANKIDKGVHSGMGCTTCHQEIIDNKAQHKKTSIAKPDCAGCHNDAWEAIKQQGLTVEKARMGVVVENAEAYKESFHAKSAGKEGGVKASCDDCHHSHDFNVPPRGTSKRTEWQLTIPNVCGAKCHDDTLEDYVDSVHGKEVME
ncbi:MAG: cytochrome c3 family protein, partial [Gammaproteobacteria bacterium]|nr:cytochrome c3 family protein [Gammaproteobacteria bacterium]